MVQGSKASQEPTETPQQAPPAAMPAAGAEAVASAAPPPSVDQQPPPGTPAPARTPRLAGWALGVGIAAILVSLLTWALPRFVSGEQRWALLAVLVLTLPLGVLAVVFGIRSQRQITRLRAASRGRAIGGWVCGVGALASTAAQIFVVVLVNVVTPGQLATQALDGMASAQTTHYAGRLDSLGSPYTLDLTANRNGDMRGSVTFANTSVELLKVGPDVYQRGQSYWAGAVDPVTLRIYGDNWVRTQAASDLTPVFVLAGGELAHDLLDRFQPDSATATTLAGSPVTKLTGPQGDLYVTRSQPVRALRFVGTSRFTSSSGLGHVKLDIKYPAPLDLGKPQKFIDPNDEATFPARFQVENFKEGACGDASCALTADVSNQGGASVGQAVATFTMTDASGHDLGSCTANIPPIDHLKSEMVGCTVSSPEWVAFAQNGGSYTDHVSVHNPVYDD
jgi:hypothetical protein